ncbi:MAG: hypothetical protein LN412_00970 [Candidatus Thermoplasmatota archaeon]|nr:hypothetical protein [Candidatus Thermoplasmatota archaeon]
MNCLRTLPHIQAFWNTCKEEFAFTGVDTQGFDFEEDVVQKVSTPSGSSSLNPQLDTP